MHCDALQAGGGWECKLVGSNGMDMQRLWSMYDDVEVANEWVDVCLREYTSTVATLYL